MAGKAFGKTKTNDKPVTGTGDDDTLDLASVPEPRKINGGGGNDSITGTDEADRINAGGGDDIVRGGLGDDVMFGNGGRDTAVFSGSILDYLWTWTKGNTLEVTGDDGHDQLKHFEVLQFDDFTFDLTQNNAPVALLTGPTTIGENDALALSIDLYDFDGDSISVDSVTYSGGTVGLLLPAVQVLANGTTNQTIEVNFDPGTAYDYLAVGESVTETLTVAFSDDQGNAATETYTITIEGRNDGPVAADDTNAGDPVVEAGNAEPGDPTATGNVLANDSDVDLSDTLRVTKLMHSSQIAPELLPNTGEISILGTYGTLTVFADGTWSYLLDDSDPDTEALADGDLVQEVYTYTVSDGNGGTDTATLTIDIAGSDDNTPPDAGDDQFDADADVSTSFSSTFLLANDSDPDGDTVSLVSVDSTSANGASILPSGATQFEYNGAALPAYVALGAGESILDSFNYTITDGNGATGIGTVSVTVHGVNDGPTANDDFETVSANDGALNPVLTSNDSDPDTNDTLSIVSLDTTGMTGLVSINPLADGVIFDANGAFLALGANATALTTFTYTISDGHGATDTATVSLTVEGENDGPTATNDQVDDFENSPLLQILALWNDTDPDTGDSLRIVSVDASGALGSVSIAGDGLSLFYDNSGLFESLAYLESTTETFTYTIEDDFGAQDTATVTVVVRGVNDDPTAVDDAFSVSEDGTMSYVVTANDTDPDASDDLEITALHTPGVLGTVTIDPDNDTIHYDPAGQFDWLDTGESTTETFSYQVTDGNGGLDKADVTVTITGVNDAPETSDVTVSTDFETVVNGAVTATDPDDVPTFALATDGGPANGTVNVNPDGTFDYTPNAGFTGADMFEVAVTDGEATVTSTVTVNVGPYTSDTGQTAQVRASSTGEITLDLSAFSNNGGADHLNVMFVMDASGSVGSTGWELTKDAVVSAITALDDQFSGSQTVLDFSVFSFSTYVYKEVGFLDWGEGYQLAPLLSEIQSLPFYQGVTRTGDATREALREFDQFTNSGEINYVFFITDGNPNPQSAEMVKVNQYGPILQSFATVEVFGIGSSVNTSLLAGPLDSDGQIPLVSSFGGLEAALQETPLFALDVADKTVSLVADGVDQGQIAGAGDFTISGTDHSVQLASIAGIADLLGRENAFTIQAIIDPDPTTPGDEVTLTTVTTLGVQDAAVIIDGTAEDDLIFGSDDADTLNGLAGNDIIYGYGGNDVSTGGLGADTFIFDDTSGSDRITDFEVGVDLLLMKGTLTITGSTEIDTNADTVADATVLALSNGETLQLDGVLGVTNTGDLLS